MNDLRELYQEMILDHGRHPRNHAFPSGTNCEAEGHNPLCGDRLTLKLRCDGEIVQEVGFQGQGCAISTASASTMTESIKGKTRAQIAEMFEGFHAMVTGSSGAAVSNLPPKLAVFAGVSEFPMRVKCAILPWHALQAALEGRAVASTE
ncbi:MAG: SUF system NifU family Fe-S cluster assembly protein [Polyangiaceae bacterium]|nr:SUF system NifU family Fe-S cluster assembly protein [Polyangiaceae bacterium]